MLQHPAVSRVLLALVTCDRVICGFYELNIITQSSRFASHKDATDHDFVV